MISKEEMVQFREEIRSLVREEVPPMIREEIRREVPAMIREEMKDVVRRDELETMFVEHGRRLKEELKEDMIEIVGTMVDDNITPQFQELRSDIAAIKRGRWQLA